MQLLSTDFEGLYIIKGNRILDQRGEFFKLFTKSFCDEHSLKLEFIESYYSKSCKGVIRGMHFQRPPFAHDKIINVIEGSICDVVLDLRKNSKTYGKYFYMEMKSNDGISLYIPQGFAHGFKALEDNTVMLYYQTSEYNMDADAGIRWDSFGFNWNVDKPVISQRDLDFCSFDDFKTPFE